MDFTPCVYGDKTSQMAPGRREKFAEAGRGEIVVIASCDGPVSTIWSGGGRGAGCYARELSLARRGGSRNEGSLLQGAGTVWVRVIDVPLRSADVGRAFGGLPYPPPPFSLLPVILEVKHNTYNWGREGGGAAALFGSLAHFLLKTSRGARVDLPFRAGGEGARSSLPVTSATCDVIACVLCFSAKALRHALSSAGARASVKVEVVALLAGETAAPPPVFTEDAAVESLLTRDFATLARARRLSAVTSGWGGIRAHLRTTRPCDRRMCLHAADTCDRRMCLHATGTLGASTPNPERRRKLHREEGLGKEPAMGFVRDPSQHSPGVISENHGEPKSGCPDRESNSSPPECESIELPLRQLARSWCRSLVGLSPSVCEIAAESPRRDGVRMPAVTPLRTANCDRNQFSCWRRGKEGVEVNTPTLSRYFNMRCNMAMGPGLISGTLSLLPRSNLCRSARPTAPLWRHEVGPASTNTHPTPAPNGNVMFPPSLRLGHGIFVRRESIKPYWRRRPVNAREYRLYALDAQLTYSLSVGDSPELAAPRFSRSGGGGGGGRCVNFKQLSLPRSSRESEEVCEGRASSYSKKRAPRASRVESLEDCAILSEKCAKTASQQSVVAARATSRSEVCGLRASAFENRRALSGYLRDHSHTFALLSEDDVARTAMKSSDTCLNCGRRSKFLIPESALPLIRPLYLGHVKPRRLILCARYLSFLPKAESAEGRRRNWLSPLLRPLEIPSILDPAHGAEIGPKHRHLPGEQIAVLSSSMLIGEGRCDARLLPGLPRHLGRTLDGALSGPLTSLEEEEFTFTLQPMMASFSLSKRVSTMQSATASTSSKFAAPSATALPPTEFGALDLRRRKTEGYGSKRLEPTLENTCSEYSSEGRRVVVKDTAGMPTRKKKYEKPFSGLTGVRVAGRPPPICTQVGRRRHLALVLKKLTIASSPGSHSGEWQECRCRELWSEMTSAIQSPPSSVAHERLEETCVQFSLHRAGRQLADDELTIGGYRSCGPTFISSEPSRLRPAAIEAASGLRAGVVEWMSSSDRRLARRESRGEISDQQEEKLRLRASELRRLRLQAGLLNCMPVARHVLKNVCSCTFSHQSLWELIRNTYRCEDTGAAEMDSLTCGTDFTPTGHLRHHWTHCWFLDLSSSHTCRLMACDPPNSTLKTVGSEARHRLNILGGPIRKVRRTPNRFRLLTSLLYPPPLACAGRIEVRSEAKHRLRNNVKKIRRKEVPLHTAGKWRARALDMRRRCGHAGERRRGGWRSDRWRPVLQGASVLPSDTRPSVNGLDSGPSHIPPFTFLFVLDYTTCRVNTRWRELAGCTQPVNVVPYLNFFAAITTIINDVGENSPSSRDHFLRTSSISALPVQFRCGRMVEHKFYVLFCLQRGLVFLTNSILFQESRFTPTESRYGSYLARVLLSHEAPLVSAKKKLFPKCTALENRSNEQLTDGAAVIWWQDCSPPTKASGYIPAGVAPGFSQVGILPDNDASRWVFWGVSRSLALAFWRCSILVSLHLRRLSRPSFLKGPGPTDPAVASAPLGVFVNETALLVQTKVAADARTDFYWSQASSLRCVLACSWQSLYRLSTQTAVLFTSSRTTETHIHMQTAELYRVKMVVIHPDFLGASDEEPGHQLLHDQSSVAATSRSGIREKLGANGAAHHPAGKLSPPPLLQTEETTTLEAYPNKGFQ
ncbi:hypothetical protein PR048_010424 [Dryococelus australis]|uniref:Uncharacterized protein n=1 Tax=Dryococelus australis TaxID=614101 RepID=A0ABQ9I2Q0_9NEOP|nr:hypothetical protein PR048_010424 [Dryococelus australis]